MRHQLRGINNVRGKFSGVFVRYGKKTFKAHETTTLLFRNITALDTGRFMTDHLWFNLTTGFSELGELAPGDVVKFEARVTRYVKGYRGFRNDVDDRPVEVDYKLSHPTKVSRVEATEAPPDKVDDLPLFSITPPA